MAMTNVTDRADQTLAAAGMVLIYSTLIGLIDNFVRLFAAEGGLWQFHAMRAAMAWFMLLLLMAPLKLKLRPARAGAVTARSLLHASAMMIYFGTLAFLPVSQVIAGLFTAPIFVLLISHFVYGHPIGPVRIIAVALGFSGAVLVLGPGAIRDTTTIAFMPVVAGALYALGNIATREWCSGETAETLLGGFFAALGIFGLIGMLVLMQFPQPVPDGPAGFVLRGAVWPSDTFLFWTFVQAAGSLLGVGFMIRAYQIAEASRVSVFEYVILPASAFWGWLLWDETVSLMAGAGMVLIAIAGSLIAIRARS